jgi:hypothetical protein
MKITKQQKIQLRQRIAEIERYYPEDKLIETYQDFLKVRDQLPFCQFNPIVFHHLAALTDNEWHSEKRVNRISLLRVSKRYLGVLKNDGTWRIQRNVPKNFGLSQDTRNHLFSLFQKSLDECRYLPFRQWEEAQASCNNMLIGMELFPAAEEWLCNRAKSSEMILNRVLRYPAKSEIISNWAKANYLNNRLRNRRAELVSWMIDREPDFEIDKQTLIDDFEYLNQADINSLEEFNQEIHAIQTIERELHQIEHARISHPELKLTKRFYRMPQKFDQDYPASMPDFDKFQREFFDKIDFFQKITMIWAIGYSRLSNREKSIIIQKYCNPETFPSVLKMCNKTNNAEVLKWMLRQA